MQTGTIGTEPCSLVLHSTHSSPTSVQGLFSFVRKHTNAVAGEPLRQHSLLASFGETVLATEDLESQQSKLARIPPPRFRKLRQSLPKGGINRR